MGECDRWHNDILIKEKCEVWPTHCQNRWGHVEQSLKATSTQPKRHTVPYFSFELSQNIQRQKQFYGILKSLQLCNRNQMCIKNVHNDKWSNSCHGYFSYFYIHWAAFIYIYFTNTKNVGFTDLFFVVCKSNYICIAHAYNHCALPLTFWAVYMRIHLKEVLLSSFSTLLLDFSWYVSTPCIISL